MRHVFASRPVSARALGMREPPSTTGLVTGSRRAGHAAVHEGRNPQRSKSGRDRNNYKSAPGPDTQRTETPWPIQRRHGRIGRRHVDERPAFCRLNVDWPDFDAMTPRRLRAEVEKGAPGVAALLKAVDAAGTPEDCFIRGAAPENNAVGA